jgi:hypothetical protein
MRSRAIVLTLAVTIGVVASAAPVTAKGRRSDPAPAAGYETVTVKKAGFRVSVPEEWQKIDLTRDDAEQLLETLREQAPELADSIPADAVSAAAANIKLFAISPTGSNFNVIVTPDVQFLPTPDEIESTVEDQFGTVATDISAKRTRVDGKKAVKGTYVIPIQERELRFTQYIVVGNKGGLVLTFTFPTGDAAAADTIKTIIKSVQLL